jgi:hypothetical protein
MSVNRGSRRGLIPKITWGASFANTLTFAQPLDRAITYDVPKDGSTRSESLDGTAEDGWTYKHRGILEGDARRIPYTTTGGITGWEGTAGWDAFLIWALDTNAFRFYPAATDTATYLTCYLADHTIDDVDEEITRHRRVKLRMRTTTDDVITGY